MDPAHDANFLAASKKHPLVPLPQGQTYKYGTAGFRMDAGLLDAISFRVGLLSALRSRKLNGQAIGVMITASHNPAADNGVKIVDPMGEMLEQEWEQYATFMVNSASDEDLLQYYHKFAGIQKIDLTAPAKVIYGRDTRPSGHKLATALADALAATDTEAVDSKILTTPQLHYLVRATNAEGTPFPYGKVSEAGYYEKLADAFVRALKGRKINGPLTVDCANGVGGPKLKEFLKYLPKDKLQFDVKVVNDDVLRPEILNLDVRACTLMTCWIQPCLILVPNLLVTVRCRLCEDEAAGPSLAETAAGRSMLLARRRCRSSDILPDGSRFGGLHHARRRPNLVPGRLVRCRSGCECPAPRCAHRRCPDGLRERS